MNDHDTLLAAVAHGLDRLITLNLRGNRLTQRDRTQLQRRFRPRVEVELPPFAGRGSFNTVPTLRLLSHCRVILCRAGYRSLRFPSRSRS